MWLCPQLRILQEMGPNSNGRGVAVTGMGFVTPIGNDLETVWSNMIEGVSGVGPITYFDTTNFDTRIAAQVKSFNPEEYMDKKTARHIGRYCQFALVASQQALAQANLHPAEMDPDDVGVIVSSAMGGMEEIEKSHTALLEGGPKRISPFTVSRMMPEMAAATVAIRTGAGGPNYAIFSACASGAHAIGEASEIIKRGDAVAMLAGGSEAAITPLAIGAFSQIKATSERNDEPEKACRPFDVGRDGFVVGEGSVMLVLEDMEHAKRRGAQILAELAGYGASADMYHFTAPHPEGKGAIRAMRRALQKSGVELTDVDYINAHGTSTQLGDIAETKAIKAVFGEHAQKLAVSSTKSVHGHLLGAAGAIEAAACVLALNRGLLPPTINLDQPDPDCDLDYVPNKARQVDLKVVISNSFGFGGHNATLVIKGPDGG